MKGWIWGATSMVMFVVFVIGLRVFQDIFDRDMVEADRRASQ